MRRVGQPDPPDPQTRRLTDIEVAAIDYYRLTADRDNLVYLVGKRYYYEQLEKDARRICELTGSIYIGIAREDVHATELETMLRIEWDRPNLRAYPSDARRNEECYQRWIEALRARARATLEASNE